MSHLLKLCLLLMLLLNALKLSRSFEFVEVHQSSIKCYTCSNLTDCENSEMETHCKPEQNSCLTVKTEGTPVKDKDLSKHCAYNNLKGSFDFEAPESGTILHYCDTDLCNAGDHDHYEHGRGGHAHGRAQKLMAIILLVPLMSLGVLFIAA